MQPSGAAASCRSSSPNADRSLLSSRVSVGLRHARMTYEPCVALPIWKARRGSGSDRPTASRTAAANPPAWSKKRKEAISRPRSAVTDTPWLSTTVATDGSSMKPLALRIDERRPDHFGVDDFPQVVDAYGLAQPLAAPRQHAERHGALEFGAPEARGHMAFGRRRRRGGRDLRAHREERAAVHRRQRHQLKSIGVACRGPQQRAPAHEIGCLALEVAGKADVLRKSRAVGFGADVNETLFRAHDLEGLDAVGRRRELLRARPQAIEERPNVIRRHIDLVAQLAAETGPQHTQRHSVQRTFANGHVLHRARREGWVKSHRCQPVPGARARDGYIAPT